MAMTDAMSFSSSMKRPNRLDCLHRALVSNQSPTDLHEYTSRYGLFLDDDQPSTLDLIVSCPDGQHTTNRTLGEGCSCYPISSHAPGTKSVGHKEESTITGYHRLNLKGSTDIVEVFKTNSTPTIVFYIDQIDHSWSRLRINRPDFETLLQNGEIFPALKDIILYIGVRDAEEEIAPPCPRLRIILNPNVSPDIFSSSGLQSSLEQQLKDGFEIAYGIRFIQKNHRERWKPWSLRQFVVYNKTQYLKNESRWLFFSVPPVIRVQIEAYMHDMNTDIASNPFDIHVLILAAAVKMWRPYFVYLTAKIIEENRKRVACTLLGAKDEVRVKGIAVLNEMKTVQTDILDSLLSIRATKDTASRIQALYSDMLCDSTCDSSAEDPSNSLIIKQLLRDQLREIDMLIEQASSQLQKTKSILATVAKFLSLSNEYSLESMTRQATLGAEAAAQDAKATRVLTFIAMVYLPISTVFSFFSTSFIDRDSYTGQPMGHWWLLLAFGVPLCFLTLLAWALWIHKGWFVKKLRGPSSAVTSETDSFNLELSTDFETSSTSASATSVNAHVSHSHRLLLKLYSPLLKLRSGWLYVKSKNVVKKHDLESQISSTDLEKSGALVQRWDKGGNSP